MQRMQEDMDTIFNSFWGFERPNRKLLSAGKGNELSTDVSYREPVADIWENENEVIATVELPGVDKKDIDVNVTDDNIEIKVEKKSENKQEDKKKGYYHVERSYSGFYRCMPLPKGVKADKAKASYNQGVLEIKIPKDQERLPKAKRLEIE